MNHPTENPLPTDHWWTRIPAALLAAGTLWFLADHRPSSPAMLWAPIQPMPDEEAQEILLLAVWLLAALISLILAWAAIKPRRRVAEASPEPVPMPRRVSRAPEVRVPPSRQLLALFATPRPSLTSLIALDADGEKAVQVAVVPNNLAATAAAPSAQERPLTLRLFGPLSLSTTNAQGLQQRATRGLIAYLALKRAPASSDEILEALWPNEPPAKTRPRLWKAKRQAQAVLGDTIRRHHDGLELDRSRLRRDIDEIESLLADDPDPERLERAVALLHGEPLADTDYPWALNERRRLQGLKASALAQVAVARLDRGDGTAALDAAELLIAVDPLNEQGWRLAMEAEAVLGQRQAIVQRYEHLAGELNTQLGLHPAAETRNTYHRLLSQD